MVHRPEDVLRLCRFAIPLRTRALFEAEGVDGVHAGGFDGWPDAGKDADGGKDYKRGEHDGPRRLEKDVAFVRRSFEHF